MATCARNHVESCTTFAPHDDLPPHPACRRSPCAHPRCLWRLGLRERHAPSRTSRSAAGRRPSRPRCSPRAPRPNRPRRNRRTRRRPKPNPPKPRPSKRRRRRRPPADGGDTTAPTDGEIGAPAEGVVASLVEWAIEAPTEYAAGDVTFTATNNGNFPHELVVIQAESYESLPLAEGGAVHRGRAPDRCAARTNRTHRRWLLGGPHRCARAGQLRPPVQPRQRRDQSCRAWTAARHHRLLTGLRPETGHRTRFAR